MLVWWLQTGWLQTICVLVCWGLFVWLLKPLPTLCVLVCWGNVGVMVTNWLIANDLCFSLLRNCSYIGHRCMHIVSGLCFHRNGYFWSAMGPLNKKQGVGGGVQYGYEKKTLAMMKVRNIHDQSERWMTVLNTTNLIRTRAKRERTGTFKTNKQKLARTRRTRVTRNRRGGVGGGVKQTTSKDTSPAFSGLQSGRALNSCDLGLPVQGHRTTAVSSTEPLVLTRV